MSDTTNEKRYIKTGERVNYVSPDRARRDLAMEMGPALRDWADKSERVSSVLKRNHMTVGAIEVASLIDSRLPVDITAHFVLPLGIALQDLIADLKAIMHQDVTVTETKATEVNVLLKREGYYRL
jgi:hypothetical protein